MRLSWWVIKQRNILKNLRNTGKVFIKKNRNILNVKVKSGIAQVFLHSAVDLQNRYSEAAFRNYSNQIWQLYWEVKLYSNSIGFLCSNSEHSFCGSNKMCLYCVHGLPTLVQHVCFVVVKVRLGTVTLLQLKMRGEEKAV